MMNNKNAGLKEKSLSLLKKEKHNFPYPQWLIRSKYNKISLPLN
jgi:ribosomal protein L39E